MTLHTSRPNMHRCFAMLLCFMMVASMFICANVDVAMCTTKNTAGSAIQNAVSDMSNQIYTVMRAIVIPLVICGLCIAGFQFLIGGNQGSEKARKIVIGCLFAVAFVAFAPLFGQAIGTWVASSGTGDLSKYNPLG